MSRKTLYLDLDDNCDFDLISIVSSYRDYRICWHINKALGIGLAMEREEVKLEKPDRLQSAAFFNLFTYEDEINKAKFYFVCNKSAGEHLVPEMKEVDFFLEIKGSRAAVKKDDIAEALKQINIIEAVFITDPDKLKSKQNLFFE